MSVAEYPSADNPAITLGSLVGLSLDDDSMHVLIVGQVTEGSDAYSNAWGDSEEDEFRVVSAESPLGSTLLGKQVGESTALQVAKKILPIVIHAIDQTWITQFAPESKI
jgi:transcription elongation GreA/GreB family factor